MNNQLIIKGSIVEIKELLTDDYHEYKVLSREGDYIDCLSTTNPKKRMGMMIDYKGHLTDVSLRLIKIKVFKKKKKAKGIIGPGKNMTTTRLTREERIIRIKAGQAQAFAAKLRHKK